MKEAINLINFVNLTILAIVLLFIKSKHKKANTFLAVILLSLAIVVLDYYAWSIDFKIRGLVYTIRLYLIAINLIGVCFYFYVQSMMGIKLVWNAKKLIHVLPFIPVLYLYIDFQLQPFDHKLDFVKQAYIDYPVVQTWFNGLYSLLCYVYFGLAYRKLIIYKKSIGNCFSNIDAINLKWLRTFIVYFSIIFIVVTVFLTAVNDNTINSILGPGIVTVFYLLIFIKTIRHPSIYSIYGEPALECIENRMSKNKKEPANGTSDIDTQEIFKKVLNTLQSKQIFLKPKLTLRDLAMELELNPNTLSYVINSETKKNFYHLINSMRIEEVKKQLNIPENAHLKIEAIGEECGFSSKSTFFRIFKETTGLTPKKYLEKQRVSKTFP